MVVFPMSSYLNDLSLFSFLISECLILRQILITKNMLTSQSMWRIRIRIYRYSRKKNRPSHVVAGHRVQCLYKRKVNRKTLFYKKQSIDKEAVYEYEVNRKMAHPLVCLRPRSCQHVRSRPLLLLR